MSLVSTLGKVAVGIMVAKGVGKMMGGQSSGGGLGGLLGNLMGGGSKSQNTNVDDLSSSLGGLLGGGKQSDNNATLGGLLNSFGDDEQDSSSSGFGDLFNDALQGNAPEKASRSEEQTAALMLRAMISAAKCDGDLDEVEQQKLSKHLGDISPEEADFVRNELQAPLDVQSLINDVPRGMENQVYLMSLMAIDLDSKAEAQYLEQLAKGLNISQQLSNKIHTEAGAPTLYG